MNHLLGRRTRVSIVPVMATIMALAVAAPAGAQTKSDDGVSSAVIADALQKAKAAEAKKDGSEDRWYRVAAEHGSAEGQFQLAVHLIANASLRQFAQIAKDGDTDVDATSAAEQKEAVDWLQKSAAQGYSPAEDRLGDVFSQPAYEDIAPKDLAVALSWYRKAAEHGNVDAEMSLAEMLEAGNGTPVDRAAATKWYEKAAAQGSTDAKQVLWTRKNALAHRAGPGLDALEKGEEVAAKGGGQDADRWYRLAAEKGNAVAQFDLGQDLVDYAAAAEYYTATQNDKYEPDAKKDPKIQEGLVWIRKSADQGYADAEFWLGDAYAAGDDVDLDQTQAKRWYEKAAAQGHEKAKAALAKLKTNAAP